MKKIISLYGLPACGKTTQADKIKQEFGLIQFGMGDRLRAEIESGSDLGARIKAYVQGGTLITDELMLEVIANIGSDIKEHGICFDGFPRMISQAEMLDGLATDLGLEVTAFIYLNIHPEEAVRRIMERAKEGDRADDKDAQAIANRLDVFNKESKILLDYYRAKGKLIEINGELGIEGVYEEIRKVLL